MKKRLCAIALMGFVVPAWSLTPADTDKMIYEWLDISRQASALELDWQAQKPLLNQRISLLAAEKAQLESLLTTSQLGQGDVDAQRTQLLAEQTQLEADDELITQSLQILLGQLNATANRLPPPLKAQWEQDQQQLKDETNSGRQLQVALAQLSKWQEFNGRVSLNEAPIEINGQQVLVKQLYLGLGAAWFMSVDGRVKGIGKASSGGWLWQQDDSLDESELRKAIGVFEKTQTAELVSLPFSIEAISANFSTSTSEQKDQ